MLGWVSDARPGRGNGRLRPGTMEPEIDFKLNSTLKVKNVPASQPASKIVITPNRQMAYTCCCGREREENKELEVIKFSSERERGEKDDER